MRTWIVTGGAGFIGANFVAHALGLGVRTVVVDKLTYAGSLLNLGGAIDHAGLVFLEADIADRPAMDAVMARYAPQAVVNFAAESHVDRSIDGPRAFLHSNVLGAFELLEAARHYWERLPDSTRDAFRFLHVSTDEVFGSLGPDGAFREDSPYAPNSPYAATKAAADHLVRAWHHTYGLPTLITNCSNNYGPYQFPEKLVPLVILNALDGQALPIYGDGSNVRDWLFVADHCAGITAALERGVAGRSYNLGSRSERTNLQMVDAICDRLEALVPATGNPALSATGKSAYRELKSFVADRPGHDRRYAIDPGRAESELGWRPTCDFEQGIDRTVRWYVDHRDWCAAVLRGRYGRERLGRPKGGA
jgi:dTDP-glucose 4,6-dehydratase